MPSNACLSAERREKKRKHDRDAQRIARERTKTRIRELEALVETLQATNEHPKQLDEYVAQVQATREANIKLRNRVRKAVELLDPELCTRNSSGQPIDERATEQQNEFVMSPTRLQTAALDEPVTQIFEVATAHKTTDGPSKSGSDLLQNFPTHEGRGRIVSEDAQPEANLSPMENDPVSNIAAGFLQNRNVEGCFWLLASTILNHILHAVEEMTTPRGLDDDIIIRVCIEGWESVKKRYRLDAGWRWLRQLDEHMYDQLSIPSRMAIMGIMRLQYLVQRHPARASSLGVPEFMKPRPAQTRVVHDQLVDHIVWPGLREHFIFSPHRYATNRFMENFRMAIRFAWPYETESAYKFDHRTELYSFTSTYIDRQWQIKYWQMDPKFFDLFPELRTEVPSAVPAPSNLFVGFEFDEPSIAREHSNEKWNVGQ